MRAIRGLRFFAIAALCGVTAVGAALPFVQAADEAAKAKHTIKEVMKIAHGKDSNLLKKVVGGEASAEDKQLLLDVYISMLEGKPSKGDEASWQTLAGKAALAAAKVVVGRDGAVQELETATNCKACHSVHKG
jgi:hypothetical protein